VEMANVAAHPEVSEDEAEVETIGALEDWCGDRHLAVGLAESQRNGSRTMVGPGRSWLPADGRPAMPFLHGLKDAVIKGQQSRRVDGKADQGLC
jgi:hypothetical protein